MNHGFPWSERDRYRAIQTRYSKNPLCNDTITESGSTAVSVAAANAGKHCAEQPDQLCTYICSSRENVQRASFELVSGRRS